MRRFASVFIELVEFFRDGLGAAVYVVDVLLGLSDMAGEGVHALLELHEVLSQQVELFAQ